MIGAVSYPNFSRFMSLTRFEQLKRYLHLNDNAQRPADKGTREYRLWHLLPLMNTLKETFKKYWRCGQHVTIDERTIPIRNRMCPIRIYNPAKPYKFGMELFVLVDSLTHYCWDFIVYDKLKTPDLHTVVVVALVATLCAAGHICILDRGFTSSKLLLQLARMGHRATGTIVKSRKMYPAREVQLDKKAAKGSVKVAVCHSDKLLACAWMDKKPVHFLSNIHGVDMGEAYRKSGKEDDVVPAPEVAIEYNKYKDGVDQNDKYCLRRMYSLEMEMVCRKWWLKGYLGLLDAAI
jgi:hypothetical protein